MKLLKTAAELKQYLPDLNINKSEATLSAHLDFGHMELRKTIGDVLYNDLETKWKAKEEGGYPLDKFYSLLVAFCQPVVAWHTFISILKSGVIQVGDAGIKETSTDNTSPVRQWVYNASLESAWNKADSYTEALLAWIEANVKRFQLYAQSPERALQNSFFIQNIDQFQKYYNINSSYRLYNVLRRQFQAVELQYVQPTMLAQLFQELKGKLAKGADLKPQEAQAIEYARAVVAFFSLRDALPTLNLNIQIGGVTVRRSDDGLTKEETPPEGHIRYLTNYLTERGNYFIQLLREYLTDNMQHFPAFRDTYKKACLPVNEHSTGIFYF